MLHVQIIGDSKNQLCQAECGPDWSQTDMLAKARCALRRKYGESVRLDYLELSQDAKLASAFGQEKNLPLLVVNGQVRLAGQFEIRQVMDIAEAQLEIGVE